jgi:alpha-tubulin suppressor-like RCC1 family protein
MGEGGADMHTDMDSEPPDMEPAQDMPPTIRARPIRVTANDNHTCALSDDGSVYCWGRGFSVPGEEPGTVGPPVKVTRALEGTTILSSNSSGTCVVSDSDKISCWSEATRTTDKDLGFNFTQLVSGSNHRCVLRDDSTIWCWGHWCPLKA